MSRRFATVLVATAGAFVVATGLAALASTPRSSIIITNDHDHHRRRLIRLSPSTLYNDLSPSLRALEDTTGTPTSSSELPTAAPVIVEYWTSGSISKEDDSDGRTTSYPSVVEAGEVKGEDSSSATKYVITVMAVLLGFLAVLFVGVYILRLHMTANRTSGKSHKTDAGDTEDPSETDFPSIIDVEHNDQDMISIPGDHQREYRLNDCPYDSLPVVSQHSTRADPQAPSVSLPRLKCPKLDRSKDISSSSSSSPHSHRRRRGDFKSSTLRALSNADGECESPIVRQMKQAAAAFNGEASNALEL